MAQGTTRPTSSAPPLRQVWPTPRNAGRIASNAYSKRTGRPYSEEVDAKLRQALLVEFGEFRVKDKHDGTPQFISSWSGKNIKELAEASNNTMRLMQYEALYKGVWSEQTHVSPAVLVDELGVYQGSWTVSLF